MEKRERFHLAQNRREKSYNYTREREAARQYRSGNFYHLCSGASVGDVFLRAEVDFQVLDYFSLHLKLSTKLLFFSKRKQLTQIMQTSTLTLKSQEK